MSEYCKNKGGKMASKALTVRIDEKVLIKLKEIAKSDLRTLGKTIEFLVKEHLQREKSIDEYYRKERPYIEHSMAQKGKQMKFEDVFHD